jgi:hypothetical protein
MTHSTLRARFLDAKNSILPALRQPDFITHFKFFIE